MKHRAYLSLGTNLDDRLANLQNATLALHQTCQIEQSSKIYETQPWGFLDQPLFLNQVLAVTTELSPFELLDEVKNIEVNLGRTTTFRFGPRIIDIDILFFDDVVLNEERLTIPHPYITERAFVMVPLAEIAPSFIHPLLQRTIYELIAEMDTQGVIPYHVPAEKR